MHPVNEALHALLRQASIDYRTVQHEPTPTSADSARARGEELKVGGKALVIKTGDDFRLFVLSAACSLDSGALKRHFGVKKTRFADAGELQRLTGLVPGAVPPFGRPILPLDLFVDPSVLANERIAFNAGLLTESIIMRVADYVRVAQPVTLVFAAGVGGRAITSSGQVAGGNSTVTGTSVPAPCNRPTKSLRPQTP